MGNTIPQEVKDKIATTLSGDPDYINKRNKIVLLYKSGKRAKEISLELGMEMKMVKAAIRWHRSQK